MRVPTLRLRWWWTIGVVWIAGYVVFVGPLWRSVSFRRWAWGRTETLLLALGAPLLGVAWLLVVAPLLQSSVPDFTDRRPAIRRARRSVIFAWIPTVIFALLMLQFGVVRLFGIDDLGWYDHGYGLWAGAALILSLVYGRLMSRTLVHRVRAAAECAGRCFGCNYDVSKSTDTCPECGTRRPSD